MTDSREDSLIGKRIREYEILEVLGKGGMGEVYRARHVLLEEERAIKVVHSRLAGSKDFIERFIREARILTRLRHPNLVQLYEFGTFEEDSLFMVLEYLQGESVLDRIQRMGRIPHPSAIRIIREAALGLNSAHQKGIIHRDISPDNLLLVKDDAGHETTKVIDFGIARPGVDPKQSMTVANLFIGKLEYSSPEQCGVLEPGEHIDSRSDIYSLGITMYQMLTGKLPFDSPTPQGFIFKHASEAPVPLTKILESSFPPALDHLVLKCLAKKPKDRFATMEDLVRDLDRLTGSDVPTMVDSQAKAGGVDTGRIEAGNLFANRYWVERKLGQGGMGAVYKAVDRILSIPVALKVVNAAIVGSEGTLERFKREVILARKVAHPNACRIYDIGESGDLHYVSMEYLEGMTLSDLLGKEGRLIPSTAIGIMVQVLEALKEAHRVGIIHRDLKPQNIMVNSQYRAWIMDFGISISADVNRVTQTGALVGSPHYMAPEQLEAKDMDHRADIYAAGVILFQILTGRTPFEADTPIGVMFAHLHKMPPKPSTIVPGFPPSLERIILKALEKDPQKRYQTATDLLTALRNYEASAETRPQIQAQKLISERSYSKAIKILNQLVVTDPTNPEFQTLLSEAVTKKTKMSLRRVKHLIDRKSLVQAQMLLEKIQKAHRNEPEIAGMSSKLEKLLHRRQKQRVDGYISEVQDSYDQKNWNAAMTSLNAASQLLPKDPRITQWTQEIEKVQLNEITATVGPILQSARSLHRDGRHKEALKEVESILERHPTFEPALTLRKEILSAPPTMIATAPGPHADAAGASIPILAPVPVPVPSRIRYPWFAIPAVVAIIAAGFLYLRPPSSATRPSGAPVSNSATQPPMVVTPQAVEVKLNALPWARVKIQPLNSGAFIQIPEEEKMTPCRLRLPEGNYAVELDNDGVTKPVKVQIQVRAGQANSFLFPMPSYDPKSASGGAK